MKKLKKTVAVLAIGLGLFAYANPAFAAVGDQGVDWAVYQGDQGRFGYAHDKFSISQIGGYNGYSIYWQSTYPTQVQYSIAQGKRAHTYIWWQNVIDYGTARYGLDTMLAQVQTPKGSIVALDAESGYQNTEVTLWALQYIKDKGYTPLLYGYRSYLIDNFDLPQIANKFGLWMAGYGLNTLKSAPDYGDFPSYDNIQIWQFTSNYINIPGGLDGNVDLTGVTDNGYKGGNPSKPNTETPSIEAGEEADKVKGNKKEVGMTVKVNFSAQNYATGEVIPDWVKGMPHKVIEKKGDTVLLDGIMSWLNSRDVETLDASTSGPVKSSQVHIVQYGESLSGIAENYGKTWQELARDNNLGNPDLIYPGQSLSISGSTSAGTVTPNYCIVEYGDTLSSIAVQFGTTVQHLVVTNSLSNPDFITVRQVLNF